MKKLLSTLLILVLCTASFSALAAPYTWEAFEWTLEIPDGLTVEDISNDEMNALLLKVDGRTDIVYSIVLQYMEELEGITLDAMSDEDIQAMVQSMLPNTAEVHFETVQFEEDTYLVVANDEGTQLHFITINPDGFFFDTFVMGPNPITQEEMELAAYLFLTIYYGVEIDEAA